MIRSITVLLTIVVLGAPAALVFIPWAVITGNATPLYNAALGVVRTAFRLGGIRVETIGTENVPPHTACIFMANHVSNLDPPALFPCIPGRTSAFLKRSLMKIPVLGYGMKLGEFVPVDRDGRTDAAIESVRAAQQVLQKGFHITTFVVFCRRPMGRAVLKVMLLRSASGITASPPFGSFDHERPGKQPTDSKPVRQVSDA